MPKNIAENFIATTWIDDQPPAIEAKQLNRIEDALYSLYYRVFGATDKKIEDSDADARKTLTYAIKSIEHILDELEITHEDSGTTLSDKSVIDKIKDNANILENEIERTNDAIPKLVNGLNSTSSSEALSANQGRVLNERIEDVKKLISQLDGKLNTDYMSKDTYVDSTDKTAVRNSVMLGGLPADFYVLHSQAKEIHNSINTRLDTIESRLNNSTGGGSTVISNLVWKTFEDDGTAHIHSYSESITKEATCIETGVKLYSCSCGDSYEEIIKTVPHSPVFLATQDRCWTCSVCNITSTEHDTDIGEVVEATCTKEGYMEQTACTVCGYKPPNVSLPRTPHLLQGEVGETNVNEIDCGEIIQNKLKCSTCDYEELQSTGVVKEHNTDGVEWVQDTTSNIHVKRCSNCDEIVVTENCSFTDGICSTCRKECHHTFKYMPHVTPHRIWCSSCETVIEPDEVNYKSQCEFENGTCKLCNYVCTHTGDDLSYVSQGDGLHTLSCLCGNLNSSESCTLYLRSDGEVLCSSCEAYLSNCSCTGNCSHSHTVESKNEGYTVIYCNQCHHVLVRNDEHYDLTEPCQHNNGFNDEVETAATCESDGVLIQRCVDCGAEVGRATIDATGHDIYQYAPHQLVCRNCGYEESTNCNYVDGYCTECGNEENPTSECPVDSHFDDDGDGLCDACGQPC